MSARRLTPEERLVEADLARATREEIASASVALEQAKRGEGRPWREVFDELRERDERLLDADAERWVAEWGGDD